MTSNQPSEQSPGPSSRTSGPMRLRRIAAIAMLALLLGVLIVPLVWPVPPLENTSPLSDLDPPGDFLKAGELDVHYRTSGSVSSDCNIVLLHGFGASIFSWRETLGDLGARCRVLAFDRPAFGYTQRPMPGEWSGESPYSLTAQADLVIAVMDAANMERAILVGHSAGAGVAVLAAHRHPTRVSALVLEAPAVLESGRVPGWMGPVLRSPQMRRIGPMLVRGIAESGSDALVRDSFFDRSLATEAVLEGYRAPLEVENWDRALWEYVAAPRGVVDEDLLGELSLPTLVLQPLEDRLVDAEQQLFVAEAIPGARHVTIANAGHLAHEEVPAIFESHIFRFIDDLREAGIP